MNDMSFTLPQIRTALEAECGHLLSAEYWALLILHLRVRADSVVAAAPIGPLLGKDVRFRRAVEQIGARTVGDLCALTREQVVAHKGIGASTFFRIQKILGDYALSLLAERL